MKAMFNRARPLALLFAAVLAAALCLSTAALAQKDYSQSKDGDKKETKSEKAASKSSDSNKDEGKKETRSNSNSSGNSGGFLSGIWSHTSGSKDNKKKDDTSWSRKDPASDRIIWSNTNPSSPSNRGDGAIKSGKSTYFGNDRGVFWSRSDSDLRKLKGKDTLADHLSKTYYGSAWQQKTGKHFDHYSEGRYWYRAPHRTTYVYNYYPYYAYERPSFGLYYSSPYWCYGSLAPYVISSRAIVITGAIFENNQSDDYYLSTYSSRTTDYSYRPVLNEIRDAWLSNDPTQLVARVKDGSKIAVYVKGKYSYSLPAEDYLTMTCDAMRDVKTQSYDYIHVNRQGGNRVSAVAKHVFTDQDGAEHVVYASFVLGRQGADWWVLAVGSAPTDVAINAE